MSMYASQIHLIRRSLTMLFSRWIGWGINSPCSSRKENVPLVPKLW